MADSVPERPAVSMSDVTRSSPRLTTNNILDGLVVHENEHKKYRCETRFIFVRDIHGRLGESPVESTRRRIQRVPIPPRNVCRGVLLLFELL